MFVDRKDAGLQLAAALEKYKNRAVIVLGIPRGGAETAYYVALHLRATFSLLVARKLGFPGNPELAFGAIAEDGSLYLEPGALHYLTQDEINRAVEFQKQEIERRILLLRQGKPLPALQGKTVLLVDDGIATGATVFAAIKLCRSRNAQRVVVAAPIAAPDTVYSLRQLADEVVILEAPENFRAVSQGYAQFFNLPDQEVVRLMQRWESQATSDKL